MSVLLAAVLAAALPVSIESVSMRPIDGGPGLVVLAHEPLPPVVVSRDGERLRVRIPGARLAEGFASPRLSAWRAAESQGPGAVATAFALRIEQGTRDVFLQFQVPSHVPFAVHQEGARLSFSFRDPDVGRPTGGRSLLVAAVRPAVSEERPPLALAAPASAPVERPAPVAPQPILEAPDPEPAAPAPSDSAARLAEVVEEPATAPPVAALVERPAAVPAEPAAQVASEPAIEPPMPAPAPPAAPASAERPAAASPAPVKAPPAPKRTESAFAALRAGDALTVTAESAGPRAIVRIRGGSSLADARVRREGGEVIVTLDVGAENVPPSPPAAPPIESVDVEKVASLAVIHVTVAPEVPFDVKREPHLLTLTFGEEALESLAPPPPPPPPPTGVDVGTLVTPELYKSLFPAAAAPEADQGGAVASDLAREGLQVGSVHLRPSLLVSYVNGDYTVLDTPEPVSDRYLQIEPRVAADTPFLGGELTADYGIRLRYLSNFDEINSTSQLLNAGLQVPVGTRTILRARDHFSTGVLESTEVDPGQEYFFDLSRFHRNEVTVGARVEAGSRIYLDGDVGYNDVRFDDATSFFPYTERTARAGLGTTLGENLRAGVYYSYFNVPPPDERPVVESTSHSVGVALEGDLGTLTRGDVRVDWQHQTSPGAAAGGQEFSGIAGQLSLSRELSPSSRVTLVGRRATDLSAFEQNAFYVSTGGQALLSFGIPWSLSANGSLGYQQNSYKTVATDIGVPREDTILGWTLGLSRPVGSFGYLRFDYRRDRRRSNLPGFDVTTDGFIVQMGLGLFGTSVK